MARANVEKVNFDQREDRLLVTVAIHAESPAEHARLAEFTGAAGKPGPELKGCSFSDGLRVTFYLDGFYGHGVSPKHETEPEPEPVKQPGTGSKGRPRGSKVVEIAGAAEPADPAQPEAADPKAGESAGSAAT